MVANKSGIFLNNSTAISKTNTCFTADNSIISAMSLGLSIVHTNYIPITEEDPLITKEIDDTPVRVNIMYL